jgi:MerR family transcriptional regulator, repressor of the yfmOP operon
VVNATARETFRIGELARRVDATPRTVRYYEQLGLLSDRGREHGAHRLYDETDEAELRELIRVRDLLGLSLQELLAWSEAARARDGLRERWFGNEPDGVERHQIAAEALEHIETQLALVQNRREALEQLEDELVGSRRRVRAVLSDEDGTAG